MISPPARRLEPWILPAIPAIVTAFFVLAWLGQEGLGNEYYAAAVRSMLQSGHNLFFAAFDPAGFLAVDKPPVGLWVQAGFAAVLGFYGWTLILPQALSAIASVVVLYILVKRDFGRLAGFIAALVLALTPISVATARNNTMDSQLVLICLLAAWAARGAADTGRLRWLLGSAALLGLGFNIKMAQALLVLPAICAVYIAAAGARLRVRLLHLALATLLLAALSLSWAVAVDLTPEADRPYVSSTQGNSVLELIVGHNAASRLGLRLSEGSVGPQRRPAVVPSGPLQRETGDPGPFRLFNAELAGQASWLLLLAVLGGALAAANTGWRVRLSQPARGLILWVAWLLPMAGFVCMAGLMHRYYLAMLAPAIAALVGAGLSRCWEKRAAGAWRAVLGALLATSNASTVLLLGYWPDWQARLAPLLVALTLVAMVLILLGGTDGVWRRATAASGLVLGTAGLLVVPLVWSTFPVIFGGDRHLPYAGPELASSDGRPRADGPPQPLVDRLVRLADGKVFLAATLDANAAAPLILATGRPVMAMGGFTGSDPILTPEELSERVAGGEVRFFWIPRQEGGLAQQPARGPRSQNAGLLDWVYGHCVLRMPGAGSQSPQPPSPAGAPANPPGPGGLAAGQPNVLYDCQAPAGG